MNILALGGCIISCIILIFLSVLIFSLSIAEFRYGYKSAGIFMLIISLSCMTCSGFIIDKIIIPNLH